MNLKFLSVCSGIEAASVAWNPLGWEAVAFSEIEPFPCKLLKHHYPDVPNLGDMRNYEDWPDYDIDVLCGGTPCQGFSVSGLRKGLKDERNLTVTFCDIADRYNPDIIQWENVPGVLSSTDNAFGCFLAQLSGTDDPIVPKGEGWTNAGVVAGTKRTVAWKILDAQFVRVDGIPYAVPQRRRRLFLIACPGKTGRPATILFEPEGLRRYSPPTREVFVSDARGVEIGPSGCGRKGSKQPNSSVSRNKKEEAKLAGCVVIAHTLLAKANMSNDCTKDNLIPVCYENHANDNRVKACDDLCPTLTGKMGTGGGNVPFVQNIPMRMTRFGEYVNDGTASTIKSRDFKDATDLICMMDQGGNVATFENGITGTLHHETNGHEPVVVHGTQFPCTDQGLAFCLGRNRDGENVVCHPLDAQNMTECHASYGQGYGKNGDPSFTLGRNKHHAVAMAVPEDLGYRYAVRRLMPVECEGLMGFPDSYTVIPKKHHYICKVCGKKFKHVNTQVVCPRCDEMDKLAQAYYPDSARYKALGNSWAVNCARWVGMRIELVLKFEKQQKEKQND